MSPVRRPTRDQVAIFPTAVEFRKWLDKNHDTASELFVGYYRKGTEKTAMTYAESVDEALCYGWIDGITHRIDDEVRSTRFTPRRKGSNWSAVNIAKVAELTRAGRMKPSGTRAFEERDRRRDGSYAHERPSQELPSEMLERLRADAAAWSYWESRSPSFRRDATYWVVSAKRPETRQRRFDALVAASREGHPPAPFIVSPGSTK